MRILHRPKTVSVIALRNCPATVGQLLFRPPSRKSADTAASFPGFGASPFLPDLRMMNTGILMTRRASISVLLILIHGTVFVKSFLPLPGKNACVFTPSCGKVFGGMFRSLIAGQKQSGGRKARFIWKRRRKMEERYLGESIKKLGFGLKKYTVLVLMKAALATFPGLC